MNVRDTFAATLLVSSLFATSALAQVCAGLPGGRTGNIQVGAGFAIGDGSMGFDMGITGVGDHVYGGATIGSLSYDEFSGFTTIFGGSLGYQLPLNSKNSAQICPSVMIGLGSGPSNIEGSEIDMSTSSRGAGVSLGVKAVQSGAIGLIPAIGFYFMSSEVELSNGVDEVSDSESYGILEIGLGIVVARRLTARPSINLPVGLDDADPIFGINVVFSGAP